MKKKDVPAREPRRAQAPEYRMLKKGEVIQVGQEVWAYGEGPWAKIIASDSGVGEKYDPEEHNRMRCLIETPKASVSASEPSKPSRKPTVVSPDAEGGK